MRDYERQLIEGLSKEQAEKLINTINKINKIIGLNQFGEC